MESELIKDLKAQLVKIQADLEYQTTIASLSEALEDQKQQLAYFQATIENNQKEHTESRETHDKEIRGLISDKVKEIQ